MAKYLDNRLFCERSGLILSSWISSLPYNYYLFIDKAGLELGLGVGLSVGVPVLVFFLCLGCSYFCDWRRNHRRIISLARPRTTVVATALTDLSLTTVSSDISHTPPPADVDDSSSDSSDSNQESSNPLIGSQVVPTPYDAAHSFPTVPVITKVKTAICVYRTKH